ncbi:MAG: GNAT family N-acetyltransferase, partial [Bacteroidales bacterium]
MMNIKIKRDCTDVEIEELFAALYNEKEMNCTQSFFFEYIDDLKTAYKNRNVFLFFVDELIAGFASFTCYSCVASIKYFWISPVFRGKNMGSFFYKEIEKYFRDNDIMILELYYHPEGLYKFWVEKIGLTKMEYIETWHENTCYKILYDNPILPYHKPTGIGKELILEHDGDGGSLVWNLDLLKEDKIVLHPAWSDDNLTLKVNGVVV